MTSDAPHADRSLEVTFPGSSDSWSFDTAFGIGRAADNEVVVDSEIASEHHVRVVWDDGAWHVRDLGSTNGLIVDGKVVADVVLDRTTWIRLGPGGPQIILTPGRDGAQRTTRESPITEDHIHERYFAREAPADMGRHTEMLRQVVQREHRRTKHKYRKALLGVAGIAVVTTGMVLLQRRQLARQRAAAAELFYALKDFELQLDQLTLDSARLAAYTEQETTLRQRYADYVEDMGLYSERTPEADRLIYQTISRFGESEVHVPESFLRDVRRAIDRWRTTNRLETAVRRAREEGYPERIAGLMLEQHLPPEFFFLALQESNFRTTAIGPRTRFGYAKGMWQIMPGTARDLGLQVGPLVGQPLHDPRDERHDFERSTRAAAQYLGDLYRTDAQASGLLVIASYNWGQNNVLRLIRSMPRNPRERNFWKLLERYGDRLPRETYQYVLNIVSAAVICEDPELFGFDFERPLPARESLATESETIAPE